MCSFHAAGSMRTVSGVSVPGAVAVSRHGSPALYWSVSRVPALWFVMSICQDTVSDGCSVVIPGCGGQLGYPHDTIIS